MGSISTAFYSRYVLVLTGTIFGMFLTAVMNKKMDFSRDQNIRNGHPGENAPGERGRKMPLDGFEGMNFEQRRVPYNKSRRQDISHNGGSKQDSARNTEQESNG